MNKTTYENAIHLQDFIENVSEWDAFSPKDQQRILDHTLKD